MIVNVANIQKKIVSFEVHVCNTINTESTRTLYTNIIPLFDLVWQRH